MATLPTTYQPLNALRNQALRDLEEAQAAERRAFSRYRTLCQACDVAYEQENEEFLARLPTLGTLIQEKKHQRRALLTASDAYQATAGPA